MDVINPAVQIRLSLVITSIEIVGNLNYGKLKLMVSIQPNANRMWLLLFTIIILTNESVDELTVVNSAIT